MAFIRQLKEQATRQNLSSSELLRAKAAQLGVSSAGRSVYPQNGAGRKSHAFAGSEKCRQPARKIGVLIGELARGNLGALRGSGITLANRAGWIDTLMSPKGMMLGGVIGGIAAAVYGLGKAWYDGQKEGEEFNRQLSLTGIMPESLPGSCGRSVVLFPGMVSRNMLQPVRWLRWWGVVHFVETISVWWRELPHRWSDRLASRSAIP
ncbi:putative tail length tape measure protein from putative prophage [Escherichia coli]|uniref:Putative tail length tape measure protein from putative prophage n=1 Tax=Escherichia coli TaxID=562 RepID=A0A376TFL4_ECOLX|nr:putative tail length tape measure protein from putative prophage [Escherichia coli]